jgi:hypothetical protein
LTEIYVCHACSYQEILRVETPGQVFDPALVTAVEIRSFRGAVRVLAPLR